MGNPVGARLRCFLPEACAPVPNKCECVRPLVGNDCERFGGIVNRLNYPVLRALAVPGISLETARQQSDKQQRADQSVCALQFHWFSSWRFGSFVGEK